MADKEIPELSLPLGEGKEESLSKPVTPSKGISDEQPATETAEDVLGSLLQKNPGAIQTEEFRVTGDEDAENQAANAIFVEVQNTLEILGASEEGSTNFQTMTRLKDEYDKLNKLLKESRKNEGLLVKKCKEMGTDLNSLSRKIQTAVKLSQTDRSTISTLQKEVKKAWKQVEINNEKESRNKDIIAGLRSELDTLKGTYTKTGDAQQSIPPPVGTGLARHKLLELQMEQEEQLRHLIKEKSQMELEHQQTLNELKAAHNQLQDKDYVIKKQQDEYTQLDEEIASLKEFLASKKNEQERELRQREKLENSLKQASDYSQNKDEEIKLKIFETKQLKESLTKTETQLQNEKFRLEKIEKERDLYFSKISRLQQEVDDRIIEVQKLANSNHEHKRMLENREEELTRFKGQIKESSRIKDMLLKKQKAMDDARMQVELERDTLRSTNSHLNRDLDSLKKEHEQVSKQLEMVSRERDLSQKNFVKSTTASQKQFNTLKLSEQAQRTLEQEISGYRDEAQKMRKLIYTLEKDRDNRFNEATRLEQLLLAKDEEINMKDMNIFDSKKKISEYEKRLKEQQTLYENVRADRNVYSKNLIESQDEISEMKRKVKIMNHQIDQLKEEIASKEAVLVKEHFEHAKLDKEKDALSTQISKLQQQLDESSQLIQNQQAEENKLRHIITEADAERLRQKKEYDSVIHERDILGTQLIRRNDELSLLYEKIRIQTSTLNKGEIQYRERLEDIRVLRLEIKRLRRERAILQTETQNVESLRNEIFRLQRDVLRERTRVKVLEEELESPMNIHRWRRLAGSDPTTYELISKIQTLQKRLIAKTEEVVEKELVIQQKEKLYTDIKLVLQRQPGPEVIEELQALASELNMYHSQVNEFKYEIERLNRDLQDMKKKYYRLRKKQSGKIPYDSPNIIDKSYLVNGGGITSALHLNEKTVKLIKANPNSGVRFSGGGFNMSALPQHDGEDEDIDYKAVTNPPQLPNKPRTTGGNNAPAENDGFISVGIDDIINTDDSQVKLY